MLNFDALPKDKPNSNTVAAGRYNATVFKSGMRIGSNKQQSIQFQQ